MIQKITGLFHSILAFSSTINDLRFLETLCCLNMDFPLEGKIRELHHFRQREMDPDCHSNSLKFLYEYKLYILCRNFSYHV